MLYDPSASDGSFKPQRGKFTQGVKMRCQDAKKVSNPNGVNLHVIGNIYENPELRFKPQRGKFTLSLKFANDEKNKVSNPNGVNLRYYVATAQDFHSKIR